MIELLSMRVLSPERIIREGVNKIEADKGPTSAYLALAGLNARRGVGRLVASAPYFATLSAAEIARDIYTSGEIRRFLSNQDQYAYHHPLSYVSGVFQHDPVAVGLAMVPLVLLGLSEGAAIVRAGQAINSAVRRSRVNNAAVIR